MKGNIKLKSLLLGAGAMILGSLSGHAAPPRPGVVRQLPDLSVRLSLKVKQYTNYQGEKCFSTTPVYTVTNSGSLAARNFRVNLYWRLANTNRRGWQLVSMTPVASLGPGQSRTWDPGPVSENVWCEGDSKIGFKVTADPDNTVAESNEGNNSVSRSFPLTFVPH